MGSYVSKLFSRMSRYKHMIPIVVVGWGEKQTHMAARAKIVKMSSNYMLRFARAGTPCFRDNRANYSGSIPRANFLSRYVITRAVPLVRCRVDMSSLCAHCTH